MTLTKTSATEFPELLTIAKGTTPAAAPAAASDPALTALQDLLKAHHNDQAVSWIVTRFPALPPREAIDVLGAWLVRQTMPAADATPATPNAAPAAPLGSPHAAL